MHECRGDRAQDNEQHPLEPASDPAHLEEDAGQHDDRRLDEDVAVSDVDELVRQDAFELRRGRERKKAFAHGQRRAARPAAGDERSRVLIRQQIEPRLR